MPVKLAAMLTLALCTAPAWAAPPTHRGITEFGVSAILDDPRIKGPSVSLHLALGDLRRVGARTYVGGELGVLRTVGGDHSGLLLALRPRVRVERENGLAFNVAAGPILTGREDGLAIAGLGFSGGAGVDYRGVIGISAEVNSRRMAGVAYPPSEGRKLTTTHVGLHVGGSAGILTGMVFGILLMISASNASGL